MMSRITICLMALWIPALARGVIYEVPLEPGQVVGAFDVNILADDVQFETASILSEIHIPLAITGEQTCILWIFDGMNSPPIYTASFTNVPAMNDVDLTTYVFYPNLQVPAQIYIGFSAQGDGWRDHLSDYWSRSTTVLKGLPGTPGEYYYGTVEGGMLTHVFTPEGDESHGSLLIRSVPIRFTGIAMDGGQVALTIAPLPIYGTNTLERAHTLNGGGWEEVTPLPLGETSAQETDPNPGDGPVFYRVLIR